MSSVSPSTSFHLQAELDSSLRKPETTQKQVSEPPAQDLMGF